MLNANLYLGNVSDMILALISLIHLTCLVAAAVVSEVAWVVALTLKFVSAQWFSLTKFTD